MAPRVSTDESLSFLFACIDSSSVKFDFKIIGRYFGIQPSAARMRYHRLRKAVKSGQLTVIAKSSKYASKATRNIDSRGTDSKKRKASVHESEEESNVVLSETWQGTSLGRQNKLVKKPRYGWDESDKTIDDKYNIADAVTLSPSNSIQSVEDLVHFSKVRTRGKTVDYSHNFDSETESSEEETGSLCHSNSEDNESINADISEEDTNGLGNSNFRRDSFLTGSSDDAGSDNTYAVQPQDDTEDHPPNASDLDEDDQVRRELQKLTPGRRGVFSWSRPGLVKATHELHHGVRTEVDGVESEIRDNAEFYHAIQIQSSSVTQDNIVMPTAIANGERNTRTETRAREPTGNLVVNEPTHNITHGLFRHISNFFRRH